MQAVGSRLLRGFGVALLLAPLSCDGGGSGPREAQLGALSMPLATVVNGIHYRLDGDSFVATGPITRALSPNGESSIVFATLPVGHYEVELLDGWSLERQAEGGGFETVEAELVSPNPRPVDIVSGQEQIVTWVFRTDGVPVSLEPGFIEGTLTVVDGSNPTPDILGDVLVTEQAQVDALSSVQAIFGGLSVGGDVTSLAALAALTSIDGDLQIEGAAALTDLDGLQQLARIGGSLELSGNPALANLRGLSALTAVDDVLIRGNGALPTCEAEWLVGHIGELGGTIGQLAPDGSVEPGVIDIVANDDGGSCP